MIRNSVRTVAEPRPEEADSSTQQHIWRTVCLTVDDPGTALVHVALLFLKHGVDVSAVTIQSAQSPLSSRMTVRVSVEGRDVDRVVRRLEKMINVIRVNVLND
jgi:acetolactate synthase small subunit